MSPMGAAPGPMSPAPMAPVAGTAELMRSSMDQAQAAFTEAEIDHYREYTCVRCGRCADVCPMNLVPTKLAMASSFKDLNLARKYNIMACFECGSCAHVCPAGLPLVQLIRTGKALVAAEAAA